MTEATRVEWQSAGATASLASDSCCCRRWEAWAVVTQTAGENILLGIDGKWRRKGPSVCELWAGAGAEPRLDAEP